MTLKLYFKYHLFFSFLALVVLITGLALAQPSFAKERELQNAQLPTFASQLGCAFILFLCFYFYSEFKMISIFSPNLSQASFFSCA